MKPFLSTLDLRFPPCRKRMYLMPKNFAVIADKKAYQNALVLNVSIITLFKVKRLLKMRYCIWHNRKN